jgi:REP element-mobilizing transposase RayT
LNVPTNVSHIPVKKNKRKTRLDAFVVMTNHIHGIIIIHNVDAETDSPPALSLRRISESVPI